MGAPMIPVPRKAMRLVIGGAGHVAAGDVSIDAIDGHGIVLPIVPTPDKPCAR